MSGDFNASMFAEVPDTRDKAFRAFVTANCLRVSRDHPTTPTYTKPDGTECSALDCILTDQATDSSSTEIIMCDTDTSDHYPIHTTVFLIPEVSTETHHNVVNCCSAKNWAKVDLNRYREILDEQLTCANLLDTITSQYDAMSVLDKVTKIMVSTKNQLAPCKKSTAKPGKPRLQPNWTPAMAAAMKIKKKAFYHWKKAGRPRDRDNPILKEHTRAKRKFRQIQRKQLSSDYKQDLESITQAKKIDTKLFHKECRAFSINMCLFPNLIIIGTIAGPHPYMILL